MIERGGPDPALQAGASARFSFGSSRGFGFAQVLAPASNDGFNPCCSFLELGRLTGFGATILLAFEALPPRPRTNKRLPEAFG